MKWFSTDRGYGFIKPYDGDKDMFVHINAVEAAGLCALYEGQEIR